MRNEMKIVNQSFIKGKLVKSIVTASQELFNPSDGEGDIREVLRIRLLVNELHSRI